MANKSGEMVNVNRCVRRYICRFLNGDKHEKYQDYV